MRSRGLEPPRVAPLAPQASASTNSATTAFVRRNVERRSRLRLRPWKRTKATKPAPYDGGPCNKSAAEGQGPGAARRRPISLRLSAYPAARGSISLTSTAMRLPLTTTVPLATGKLLARI